jgi:hypothetical protein
MQRTIIATLMALALGLICMPATQAAPANGLAVGSAADAASSVVQAQWRGRYRRHRRWWHGGWRW